MASDLSQFIEDSIISSLKSYLDRENITLKQATKTHPEDIKNTKVLCTDAAFTFFNGEEEFSSLVSYMVPAKSAEFISNMLKQIPIDDNAIVEEIPEEVENSIGGLISNVSGSLNTLIKESEFEDLKSPQFYIASKAIIDATEVGEVDNTYRFAIDLDGHDIEIYVSFDEALQNYLDSLSKSPVTEQIEEELVNEPEEEVIKEEEPKEEEKEEDPQEEPKKDKMKLIVIGLAGLLGLVVLSAVVMYFMGVFDEEPIPENTKPKVVKKENPEIPDMPTYKTLKKVNFQESDINKNRLNRRLKHLTKYTILTPEELAQQKASEEKMLEALKKEQELIEFAKLNKEEPLNKDTKAKKDIASATFTQESFIQESDNLKKNQQPKDDGKLKFITTKDLQYKLFKGLVAQVSSSAKISICSNITKVPVVYIGPFETKDLQDKMANLIKTNLDTSIELISISNDEFDKNCNF